ncbi:MAG TPA: type IV pilus twitching motility protein PilT [Pseudobdellovibrionaceae bacterium]|nr:type IV pilus twitching motility protein PilT [Pseudobdellovibrionaceae bacterium]
MTLREILELAMKKEASDVHLKAGLVPVIRKHGKLRPLMPGLKQLTADEVEAMANEVLDDKQREDFARSREVDIGYGVSGLGRFRINIFRQRGSVRMVIRTISFNVPTIESLNLPSVMKEIAQLERGLVIVTGITGSGKSSTLAALVNEINHSKNSHILTIEDPIEFLIRDKKSIISQREIGQDTGNFASALRAALRQDPDVILIGEMRDRETMEIALEAAETGHLVLSTLHTLDAQESINRIVTVFEAHRHDQVRRQIASVLRAVISQRLCRRKDKTGFLPAVELLLVNQRVRESIEDAGRNASLRQIMEESRESVGMQSFDQSLYDLLVNDLITFEEALSQCTNPDDFKLRFSGVNAGENQWQQNNPMNLNQQRHKQSQRDDWKNINHGLSLADDPNGDMRTGTDDE